MFRRRNPINGDSLFEFGGAGEQTMSWDQGGGGGAGSGGMMEKQFMALMKRGFEEFERHIILKINEEKIRTTGELNVSTIFE